MATLTEWFIIVLNRRQSQENGLVLHEDVDCLLHQSLQFSSIGMLIPLDLGDHLLDRPDRFKEDLLGNFLQIPFPKGIVPIFPFKGLQGVNLDRRDAFLFHCFIEAC